MSFRSRSRNVQPTMQRRSLSGSRLPSIMSSFTSTRPMSSIYPSSVSYTPTYNSSYSSSASSRDSISGPISRNNIYYGGNSLRRDSYNANLPSCKIKSDRYMSPYTTYENGVTTAGLSIKSSYSNNVNKQNKGYVPFYPSKSINRDVSYLLSSSNTSVNSYSPTISTATTNSQIGRSQSFRDQIERKHRTLRRNSSLKSDRSLSISSEKSEGYEVRR